MFKALLVGAGGMGNAWARNLQANSDMVNMVGWVDIRENAAAESAEAMKLTLQYTGTDLQKALRVTQPDFLVDVTIPEAHRDVTITALNAGVHVIGEKPMAHSMQAAREMVQASEKSGKLYMVSQSRRYDGRLHAYKKLIVDHIGDLGILKSDFYIGAHFGGFRDIMPHVLVLDMAIHTFDAARFLCDRNPLNVYCEEFNPAWSWYKQDSSATALFEMDGGLRYTYCGSWSSEGKNTSWESEWRAVGAAGTALWDGGDDIVADRVTSSNGFTSSTAAETAQPIQIKGGINGSLHDFLNALQTGSVPMGECHDNIKSLAMVFAAIESASTGRRTPVTVW